MGGGAGVSVRISLAGSCGVSVVISDSCFCGRFVGLEGMGGSSGSICCGRVGLGGIVGMEGVSSTVVGEGRAI